MIGWVISLATMRRLLMVVALSAAACGEPEAPSPGSTCAEAFATAVGVGTGDEGVAWFALRPVFRACTTVAEWTAGFDRYHGLGYLGSATEVLEGLCQEPEVAVEPLCVATQ